MQPAHCVVLVVGSTLAQVRRLEIRVYKSVTSDPAAALGVDTAQTDVFRALPYRHTTYLRNPRAQEKQIYYVGAIHYSAQPKNCLLYTSPSPRDATLSRMPSSA